MKLTIEINGYQQGDLELALQEVLSNVGRGFLSGFNSNDTGSYSFSIEGQEVEEWAITCGDYKVGDGIEEDVFTYPDRYSNLDEAQSALTDDVPDDYRVVGLNDNNIILVEIE